MSKKKNIPGSKQGFGLAFRAFDEVAQHRFKKQNPLDIHNYRGKTIHQALLGTGDYLEKLSQLKQAEKPGNGLFDVKTDRGVFCSMQCARKYHERSAYDYELEIKTEPIQVRVWFHPKKHGHACEECEDFLNGWVDLYGRIKPTIFLDEVAK